MISDKSSTVMVYVFQIMTLESGIEGSAEWEYIWMLNS